ncbi:MAG: putative 2-aminoethylphosphonate ABC transporter substrate-binding protein, partial [Oscillospiraceae bacterium]|nr:putative 2-aminoethylphosphonate ABC transporter substrate-binding protein [Oscillospiraceae bacterium]
MKKILSLIMVLIMGTFLLVGCGGGNTGRTITIYTALENELIDRYLSLFREQHPDIRINIVRDSTGVITARLLAEGANTSADLIWGLAGTSVLLLEERGMLEPYAPV